MSSKILINGKNKSFWCRKWSENKAMVAGIDNWLFRGGDDNKECEPEIESDGNISCKKCKNKTCEYWLDYNNEVKK